MHQSTTPSLSQTIWPRWASRQFITLPIVQSLLPVTFDYSLSSEAVVMRQGDERGFDEGHWHAHTRGLPWGYPEVVRTVQQVFCSQRRLLRRGLEFHVCSINKSAHTKKVWKLIVCTSYIQSREKLVIVVEGNPKAPFSVATTPSSRGKRYTFPYIAPLYHWSVSYKAEW